MSQNTLKYTAFIPPDNYPTEISVFRIDQLADTKIWEIASDVVDPNITYRGDLKVYNVRNVRNASLDVIHEPTPHDRHANIINFPVDKAQRKLVAMEIASCSKLRTKQ